MDDAEKQLAATKYRFMRRLSKVNISVTQDSTDNLQSDLDNLTIAYNDHMVNCDKYHDILLELYDAVDQNGDLEAIDIPQLCNEHTMHVTSIDKEYCDAVKCAKQLMQGDRNGEPGARAVKHEVDSSVQQQSMEELVKLMHLPKPELSTFDGSVLAYHDFMSQFKGSVDQLTSDSLLKLNILKHYCVGDARDLIKNCGRVDPVAGYKEALQILKERCGSPHLIVEKVLSELRSKKPTRSARDLQELADKLDGAVRTLHEVGKMSEIDTQSTIKEVMNRVQFTHIKTRWQRMAIENLRKKQCYPTLEDLREFLRDEARIMNDPVYGQEAFNVGTVTQSGAKPKSISHFTEAKVKASNVCPLCEGEHRLYNCEAFKALTVAERLEKVNEKKLCRLCLSAKHFVRDCGTRYRCPDCHGRHSQLLHLDYEKDKPAVTHVMSNKHSILPCVSVVINNCYRAWALLDSGSTDSFISRKVIKRLNLSQNVMRTKYSLSTLSGSCGKEKDVLKGVEVKSVDGIEIMSLSHLGIVDSIPVSSPCVDMTLYPHLKELESVLPASAMQEVDLLIGQDHAAALMPLDVKIGKRDEPFAVKTLFGWTLYGATSEPRPLVDPVISNFVSRSEKNEEINMNIDKLWHVENADVIVSDESSWSVNDKHVIRMWQEETVKKEGHYEVPIPFKSGCRVPNNIMVAESRLCSLKKSLEKRNLMSRYQEEIDKLLEKGYAEPVMSGEDRENQVWYLPHHAVITPKKPDKLRVVYDCAAVYKGESLNDKCHQGPDLINKLVPVLLRFRQKPVAVCADVREMYLQVKIPERQRDCLRFLWFDKKGQVVKYRMTGHIFGGVWCASSSAYALRRTAVDDDDVDGVVKDVIMNSFYVDDMLHSVETVEEGEMVVKNVTEQLQKGGFHLTKFVVNEPRIHEQINEEERAKECRIFDQSETTALGVRWNVYDDEFIFRVSVSEDVVTRRTMLRLVASMFDPLGLLNPFTVSGKILLQRATKCKIDWDEEVVQEIEEEWKSWVRDFENLNNLKIPRCMKLAGDVYVELHHFSDSSQSAYGCVSYLRSVSPSGEIKVSLVMSKAKLCPIKEITLPRLELQAAVLAVKVDSMLRRQLTLELGPSTFWVDSQIVLDYIRAEDKRFKVFVGNRVGMIRSSTAPEQWFHISGSENTADCVTRGLTVEQMLKSNWICGPEFLLKYKSEWETDNGDMTTSEIEPGDPEVKSHVLVREAREHPVDVLLSHYSSFARMKRAVAWILKVKKRLRKINCTPDVTVEELQEAEKLIVKHVQWTEYPKEIEKLQKGEAIPRGSSILKLNPVLHEGVLRVKGRVSDVMNLYPVIIPHGDLAHRIIRDQHDKTHVGVEWLHSMIRERYWIIRARKIIKSISCMKCLKLYANPMQQIMSNLPEDRVKPGDPPFTITGVDVFGPILITEGRKTYKRYGCLFVCMVVRAIHIEVLNSLEADAFINAFIRFSRRRRVPKIVYSDNGTNIASGSKEICESHEVEWKFIPPHAPNFGGAWERLVGVLKRVLNALLPKEDTLDGEKLSTLLVEVEAIVNSRPMTRVSDDPLDGKALTPDTLLRLHSTDETPSGNYSAHDKYRRRWRHVQHLANVFWKRWTKLYILSLSNRVKWNLVQRDLKEGDLVLMIGEDKKNRRSWPMALVQEVKHGRDGHVRTCTLRTSRSTFVRPINQLVLLEAAS